MIKLLLHNSWALFRAFKSDAVLYFRVVLAIHNSSSGLYVGPDRSALAASHLSHISIQKESFSWYSVWRLLC